MLLAKNKRGCTTWHVAALNGKLEACETLRNFAKETEIYLDVRLLAQTEEVFTAPHIAAQRNNVDILQKEWELFVAMPVNPTAEDKDGYTARFRAAEEGNLETLELIFCRAKEGELYTDELLLAQNEYRNTALHIAAR